MEFRHQSVLLAETIDYLQVKPDGIYVDGTLGGGGHALEVCRRLTGQGRLIGIDRDADAIEAAQERLIDYKDRVTILRGNYCDMKSILAGIGVTSVDGILLDLGVSSFQLDTVSRGFTYRGDAPLDMRMDAGQALSAAEVVNTRSEEELVRIIRDYGEERYARNIARRICAERQKKPLTTTGELAEIIRSSIPAKSRAEGGHPAKRTFQAIRIEVNNELGGLQDSLDELISLLRDGGRICIITFHSLEDRIVKNTFRKNENPCICPPDFPVCVCGRVPTGFTVTRKPVLPGAEETAANRRAKSAKLRVFERRTDPAEGRTGAK